MMQLALMILRMHLIPLFPPGHGAQSTETNLSGLVKGCRQPSKSDQVPDLDEHANLTQIEPSP